MAKKDLPIDPELGRIVSDSARNTESAKDYYNVLFWNLKFLNNDAIWNAGFKYKAAYRQLWLKVFYKTHYSDRKKEEPTTYGIEIGYWMLIPFVVLAIGLIVGICIITGLNGIGNHSNLGGIFPILVGIGGFIILNWIAVAKQHGWFVAFRPLHQDRSNDAINDTGYERQN